MLGKRLKRTGEEEKKPPVINRYPKPPPNECVFVDTEQLTKLAGTPIVLHTAFSIHDTFDLDDRFIPLAETFYAVIIHRQRVPREDATQAEHDEEVKLQRNNPIFRLDTYILFSDRQGTTRTINYSKNVNFPMTLALLRVTGTRPYRQHVLLTLLMGAFHSRVGRDSSLYRQFSQTPFGEPHIMRLIMDF